MDSVSGFDAKTQHKLNHPHVFNTQLWVSRVADGITLFLFLILSILLLGSIFEGSSSSPAQPHSTNLDLFPLLFRDLTNQGLLKTGDKALFVRSTVDSVFYSPMPIDVQMDLISDSDLQKQRSIPEATFDFAFVHDFSAMSSFIDRALKMGGIAAVQLSNDGSVAFSKPSNYRIVYLRQFDSTVVAMRKTGHTQTNSETQTPLCGLSPEAKKAALKNLEDVLLEPPRAASRKSRSYQKRTKYLPDLTGDSLESYPRRVFIDVGPSEKDDGSHSNARWFTNNYPTKNLHFEMYKIETATEESKGKEEADMGMSEWVKKNVKEEEYVVMKAEAEVVEEMVKNKAIGLVDELFLECKPKSLNNFGKRAYWECLALYGRLRDEGVAVHQWWA